MSNNQPKMSVGNKLIMAFAVISLIVFFVSAQDDAEMSEKEYQARKSEIRQPDYEQQRKDMIYRRTSQMEVDKQEYLTKITKYTDNFNTRFSKKDVVTKDQILAMADLFSMAGITIQQGKRFTFTDADNKIVNAYKKAVIKQQIKLFPVMRDRYGPHLRKALWKLDITAKTHGKRFTTVTLTGGTFAANKYKQAFQDGSSTWMKKLRFQKSIYKWYQYDEEYTYYTLKNPKDSIIAIYKGNRFSIQ